MGIKTRFTMKVPKFSPQKDLLFVAERIVIPELAKGIDRGVDIEGRNFPRLEQATIKLKGHDRPLIDEGKLRISFKFRKHGKEAVKINLKSNRRDIGEFLQLIGIKSRRGLKFFNFFGITDIMEAKAIKYMKSQIEKAVQLAR